MNSIPLAKSTYNNNPDLLNAILYTHFEDALVGELQVHEELDNG